MDIILSQLIDMYAHWYATCDSGRDDLAQLLMHMRSLSERGEVRPNSLPVVERWLSAEMIPSPVPEHAALVASIQHYAASFDWIALPSEYAGSELASNFAFTTIAGPRERRNRPTFYETDLFACGFSLQAPNIFYAPHYHEPREFYTVLSGESRWQHGDKPPEVQPPGAYIYHSTNLPHAMETADVPLLAAWAWLGDLSAVIHVPATDWL